MECPVHALNMDMDMDRTCLHFHGACFVCLTLYTGMLGVLYLLYSICSLLYVFYL
jgi:hypothetical protein